MSRESILLSMIGFTGLALSVLLGLMQKPKPDFAFLGTGYFFRYAKDDLQEFTPQSQTDLNHWTDMVTVVSYPKVTNGEALADIANKVLGTYQANGAKVVRTDSVPKSDNKAAEHLIVVLFPQKEFIEASFTRVLLHVGKGVSVVYSHRIYGKRAGDEMSDWLLAKGEKTEKALMTLTTVPARNKK